MADSDMFNVISSSEQMRNNYEQFKDKFVDKDSELISQETFLKLLVAEMSNQDPLEPTSNTEFISQLAQFSSMQYMQDSSKYSQATYATSLVGKTATGSKMDGVDLVIKTGVVEKVVAKNNSFSVFIDGVEFDITKITSVSTEASASGTASTDALDDRIARAAAMVGKYAFVKTGEKTEDGEEQLVEGFIESILVKDNSIKIVVNGEPYAISDIEELTDAWIVEDPESPEAPTDPEEGEEIEDVEDLENPGSGETVEAGSLEDIPDDTSTRDLTALPGYDELTPEEQEMINQLQDLIGSM